MNNRKRILLIENQRIQFNKILFKLKDSYEVFPTADKVKKFTDLVRIYLNNRYPKTRRSDCFAMILEELKNFKPELLIIDHVLVGNHSAKTGIDLAIEFRKHHIDCPIIFFSRTEINNIEVCKELPKVTLATAWVFKGYAGREIFVDHVFEKEVIQKIEKMLAEADLKGGEANKPKKKKIFFSYSPKDEKYREELDAHFAGLKKIEMVESWHPMKIIPGQGRSEKIEAELRSADVVLLLLSSDFMDSMEIWENEIINAQNGGKKIVPIFLRHCHFKGLPIANMQGVPFDDEGKGTAWIVSDRWHTRDAAYLRVVENLTEILES